MSKIVTANLALYILISLLLFSFSVQDVSAQCMVGGHVYNKGGAVIEGATIRILSRQDSILAQTITDNKMIHDTGYQLIYARQHQIG